MSSAFEAGNVVFDMVANSSGFNAQIKSAASGAESVFKSSMGKIGGLVATAFSITAITAFSKECIELGSDLAEVQNVVDVTFGDGADKINAWSKTTSSAFGLSELSAKQYSGTMGAMLKSMGLATDTAMDMSMSITELAGDMASFYNLDTDAAFEKIRSGISGETEPLKQLGINMSVANLEAYALSKGITTAYNKMSQSEQALLRYNYLMSVTASAQGDFSRTSDGWANQVRVLTLNFDALKASVGSLMINVLTPLLKQLNKLLEYLNAVASRLTSLTGGAQATSSMSSSLDGISSSASSAADSILDTGTAAETAAKKAKNAFAAYDELNVLNTSNDSSTSSNGANSGLVDSVVNSDLSNSGLIGKTTSISNEELDKITGKLKNILWYVGAIATGLGAWKLSSSIMNMTGLTKEFSKLKKLTLGAGIVLSVAGLVVEVKGIVDIISNGITPQNILETVGGAAAVIAGGALIGKTFGSAVVGAAIGAIVGGIGLAIAGIGSSIKNGISVASAALTIGGTTLIGVGIGAFFTPMGALIGGLIGLAVGVVTDIVIAIVQHWDEIKAWFNTKIARFNEIITSVKTKVLNAFSFFKDLYNSFASFFSGNFRILVDNVKQIFNFLAPYFEEVWNKIKTKFEPVVSFFKNIFTTAFNAIKSIFTPIVNFFAGLWDKIKAKFSALGKLVGQAISGAFKGVINFMLSSVENVLNTPVRAINKLNSVINKIPGLNLGYLNELQLPRLAQGGYVAANSPQLAIVGDNTREGEIVTPESKIREQLLEALKEFKGNIASTIQTIKLEIEVLVRYPDGRTIIKKINEAQIKEGRILLEV